MEREKLIDLVQKAQKGDPAATEALFTEFYNDVYYFAVKTVKDPDLACDITQETFIHIIRNIASLQEPAAFVTWMKKIAYHQCTRYFQKTKEVLVEEDEDGNSIFDTLADESEGSIPSEVLEQEEFRKTILSMIDQLTEEQRSAVMLYYFDELSVGQIAQIQGVSEGTVKSRLNYARKGIKKSVEDYEKKHDIKLHSFSLLPLLMLFFGREALEEGKAARMRAAVMEAVGMATGAAAGTAAGTAAVGALVAKIAAGVVAAALAIWGVTALLPGSGDTGTPTPTESIAPTQPPHQHSYTLLLSREEPTCQSAGWEILQCECGEETQNTLEATEHEFSIYCGGVNPTCSEDGYREYACVCGETERYIYNKTGNHNYSDSILTSPTYSTTGTKLNMCWTCGLQETVAMEKLDMESEFRRLAQMAVGLPNFTSADTLTAGWVYNVLTDTEQNLGCISFERIKGEDPNGPPDYYKYVYSVEQMDAYAIMHFGRTYDFKEVVDQYEAPNPYTTLRYDADTNCITWTVPCAFFGHSEIGHVYIDSVTTTDDIHYTVEYYMAYHDEETGDPYDPSMYGTLTLTLTEGRFLITSHAYRYT